MKKPAHAQALLNASLLLLILLAAGALLNQFNFTKDVTANSRHQLTTGTHEAVKGLSGAVEIIAVLGKNAVQRNALTELVDRYKAINPLITLRFINPETDPEGARSLNASASGELIIRGMGREQRLTSVSERSLTGALRQLNREGERKLAFVTGHDERSPVKAEAPHWQSISENLARIGIQSEELSLVSQPRINDSVNVLVLADPRRPYFPGEIASLLEYVNLGGNLLWLLETDIQSQTGSRLQALALELGIDNLAGTVIDTASQNALQGQNSTVPNLVLLDRFTRHPVSQNLTSPLLIPQAKALSVTPLAGQTLLPLLQTPEASWTETGKLEGAIKFDSNTAEQTGPLTLGITIERNINNKTQRIAVIGDADFASNQFVGNGGNRAFTESLILWLSGDVDALNFVTQAAPDSQLILSNTNILFLSATLLVGIPLLLLLSALVITLRRRR